MYIWNIKALVEDFRAKKVSQADRVKYFIFVVLLGAGQFFVPIPFETFFLGMVNSILSIFLFSLGVIWCYQTNKNGDNIEFIDRFFCLLFLISVRMIIILIIISMIFPIFNMFFETNSKPIFGIFQGTVMVGDVVANNLFVILVFWWIRKCIFKISHS